MRAPDASSPKRTPVPFVSVWFSVCARPKILDAHVCGRPLFADRQAKYYSLMKRHLYLVSLATLATGCGAATSGDATYTAEQPSCVLIGPTVRPSSATLYVGDTLRAAVSPPPLCGRPEALVVFRWSSSDTLVASVDPLDGLIHARDVGTVTIIAYAVADPNIKGGALVNVRR